MYTTQPNATSGMEKRKGYRLIGQKNGGALKCPTSMPLLAGGNAARLQ